MPGKGNSFSPIGSLARGIIEDTATLRLTLVQVSQTAAGGSRAGVAAGRAAGWSPTFQKPRPPRRQLSSRCTRPSCLLAASQHSAGKSELCPCPGASTLTMTWLTYQAGEGPRLSCQRRTLRSGPSRAGALRTHSSRGQARVCAVGAPAGRPQPRFSPSGAPRTHQHMRTTQSDLRSPSGAWGADPTPSSHMPAGSPEPRALQLRHASVSGVDKSGAHLFLVKMGPEPIQTMPEVHQEKKHLVQFLHIF